MVDNSPVLEFLYCRTPASWVAAAIRDSDTLLLDHASLELKAAQQAQKLIWKYGLNASAGTGWLTDEYRMQLLNKMSRLAREELRHFEQVLKIVEQRGIDLHGLSASRYATRLHDLVRGNEPGRLIDSLIVGAIIEARSCERFSSLVPDLQQVDAILAKFYQSLLRSESRHFQVYLDLAQRVADHDILERVRTFLQRDAELVQAPDPQFRFHSGAPACAG